jgi:hypothetical protein
MLFFKRILGSREPDAPPDRRVGSRYPVGARFPMKVLLNMQGRDEMGQTLRSKDGTGWDWTGRLVDLSPDGARMQVPPTMLAHEGDACQLKFEIEGYQLALPATLAHISERRDSFVYGLQVDVGTGEAGVAYRQLLELVALGATLKPVKPSTPDESSGYLVEQYAGEDGSGLEVWREAAGRTVTAFDFRLKECRVRGLHDRAQLEYLVEVGPGTLQPAAASQAAEIHRLFHWVVPNIAKTVPADVREFLQKFAA